MHRKLGSGKWYFFQKDGLMKTGWYLENGKWYYFIQSGALKIMQKHSLKQ
ncbi:hypothetical protein ACIQXV_26700 [Neobacillus sp. NPDC097160]